MSIKLMQLVWDTPLPQTRKMVMLSLADQANDHGECYPSVATIAARCSCSRRTVFEALADLEAEGFLSRKMLPGQRVLFKISAERLRQLELPGTNQCATRTSAPRAPVQEAHQCASRTSAVPAPPGAPAAPDRCATRTPIKATPIEPPKNQGGGKRANPDELVERQDEWNRLNEFDQRLIEPYMPKLPLGIRLATFAAFVKHWQVLRRALSISSWLELSKALERMKADGVDLDASLRYTMRMGWCDPVPPRAETQPHSRAGPAKGKANDDFTSATYSGTSNDDLPFELRDPETEDA